MIRISQAGRGDLAGLLRVQHEAFARVADEVGIRSEDMPPVQETLEGLHTLRTNGYRFWIATDGEEVVGTVRGVERDGTVEIGRLAVSAGHVRRGIASQLMAALEDAYPEADVFCLFTGYNAEAALALYRSLGYRHVRDEVLPTGYRLAWLEKRRRETATRE